MPQSDRIIRIHETTVDIARSSSLCMPKLKGTGAQAFPKEPSESGIRARADQLYFWIFGARRIVITQAKPDKMRH